MKTIKMIMAAIGFSAFIITASGAEMIGNMIIDGNWTNVVPIIWCIILVAAFFFAGIHYQTTTVEPRYRQKRILRKVRHESYFLS